MVNHISSAPPTASYQGHVMTIQDVGAVAATCERCGLSVSRKEAGEGFVLDLCPESPEGKAAAVEAAAQPGLTDPCIAVPEGFTGNAAEAVALAVAGAVAALEQERNQWRERAAKLYGGLATLVEQYPQTSFAGPGHALESAQATLLELAEAVLGTDPKPTP